ncbi:histidine kinase [Vallitaleaceae bacterium 9-2]
MKKHIYRDELRHLLITYTIVFILVSIVLMIIFVGVYTNIIVRRQTVESNDAISEVLTYEMEAYVQFLENVDAHSSVVQLFEDGRTEPIYESLYDFNNSREIQSVFYIVNPAGETIISNNNNNSPYNSIDIFLSGIFKEMSETRDIVFDNNKVQIDLSKRTVYSLGKAIYIDDTLQGYLLFELIEQDLLNNIENLSVDIFTITDQYYNSILTNNASILDDIGKLTIVKKYEDKITFKNTDYYFYEAQYLEYNIRVFTFSQLNFINELLVTTSLFMMLAMIIVVIIVVKISDILAQRKTKSIQEIIQFIDIVKEGNLDARIELKTNDEFEIIANQLNRMLERIGRQVKVNEELGERNKTAVIKQLEAQFNPHFIFNTLETLKYLIQFDAGKSMEMIIHFAKILRYSIDYEQDNIQLKDDLDYLRSYLQIQKYRYNKRLTYTIKYDDELAQAIVPKLILQPIVENCIVHGYKNKENLHIDIMIEEIDKAMVMYVKDNGDGISEESMQQIKANIQQVNNHSSSIGVNNVHQRLQLLYGGNYGVDIKSVFGEGTIVVVRIPIEM